MAFPRPSSPRTVLRDLKLFFSTLQSYHYLAALAALAVTAFIIFGFWKDSDIKPQPRIVYVENWPADRTDAEIIADQKRDSAEKHALAAERRHEFQKLDRELDSIGLK